MRVMSAPQLPGAWTPEMLDELDGLRAEYTRSYTFSASGNCDRSPAAEGAVKELGRHRWAVDSLHLAVSQARYAGDGDNPANFDSSSEAHEAQALAHSNVETAAERLRGAIRSLVAAGCETPQEATAREAGDRIAFLCATARAPWPGRFGVSEEFIAVLDGYADKWSMITAAQALRDRAAREWDAYDAADAQKEHLEELLDDAEDTVWRRFSDIKRRHQDDAARLAAASGAKA